MRIVFTTSPEAGSGKTAALVAIGQQLRRSGQKIGYARVAGPGAVEDARFVTTALRLASPAPVILPVADQLAAAASSDLDVLLVESAGGQPIQPELHATLQGGTAIHLVVAKYEVDGLVDRINNHAEPSPDLKVLVLINAVPEKGARQVRQRIVPILRGQGYPVVGVIPQDRILLGMAVGDLASLLSAEVLCAHDQLNLPVEAVMISAMSDEGAEEYFRRIPRKAVVAGGDRPDIHMPALATDTSCIVLTEGHDPDPTVLKTADEQGIPLLKVTPGTMPTLDNVSHALRSARFRQTSKIPRVVALFAEHLDQAALFEALGLARQGVGS